MVQQIFVSSFALAACNIFFILCFWALPFIRTTFLQYFTVYSITVSVVLLSTAVVAAAATYVLLSFCSCSAAHCCSAAIAAAAVGSQATPFCCGLHYSSCFAAKGCYQLLKCCSNCCCCCCCRTLGRTIVCIAVLPSPGHELTTALFALASQQLSLLGRTCFTRPTEDSVAASLSIVGILICSSDKDLWQTGRIHPYCPCPPIAVLQMVNSVSSFTLAALKDIYSHANGKCVLYPVLFLQFYQMILVFYQIFLVVNFVSSFVLAAVFYVHVLFLQMVNTVSSFVVPLLLDPIYLNLKMHLCSFQENSFPNSKTWKVVLSSGNYIQFTSEFFRKSFISQNKFRLKVLGKLCCTVCLCTPLYIGRKPARIEYSTVYKEGQQCRGCVMRFLDQA